MPQGEIFVQLSVNMADDPKMRALARFGRDARRARDLYVQMILYCRENLSDGMVPDDQLGILAYPDSPAAGLKDAERLAEVGLLGRVEGGWYVPAFLKRNPSRAQVRAEMRLKAQGAQRGNHKRWHVRRGLVDPDCPLCAAPPPDGPPPDDPPDDQTPDQTTDRTTDRSTDRSTDQTSDRGTDNDRRSTESPETETETETETDQESSTPRERGRATGEPGGPPPAEPQRPDGLTSRGDPGGSGGISDATAELMSRTSGHLRRGRPPRAEAPSGSARRDGLSGIPDDFAITDAMRRWAISTVGEGLDLDFETQQFISYYRSTGDRRRSWPDQWQKWIRDSAKRAAERARRPPVATAQGGTDARLAGHADLIRRLASEEGP